MKQKVQALRQRIKSSKIAFVKLKPHCSPSSRSSATVPSSPSVSM
jgi:hypothetical protein